jgi:hypothetical protein
MTPREGSAFAPALCEGGWGQKRPVCVEIDPQTMRAHPEISNSFFS